MTAGAHLLLIVYSVVLELIVWVVLVPLTVARIAAGRTTADELPDRLGRTTGERRTRAGRPCILVHAVSAGEMNAARPLVASFGVRNCHVVLTTGTGAGMRAAQQIAAYHPNVECCLYMPWDRRAVRRWMRAVQPQAAVVVETEIWPNLFANCRDLQIPLFVVNGRIRVRDVPRYRFARGFFRPLLECATWIGVQSARERDAFVAIGAPAERVEIAGSLKFDAASHTPLASVHLAPDARQRSLLVAGSTHRPEERWLLDCFAAIARQSRGIRLVLAPRDIRRAGTVARLAARRGLRAVMWSTLRGVAPDVRETGGRTASWDALVLDEHGGLASFYPAADIVFIGGTLARIGGHNILEPAAAARPILIGPHAAEIEALVEPFARGGAIVRLSGTDPVASLVHAIGTLLADPERAREMGIAAREICHGRTGSAERYCQSIVERLTACETVLVPELDDLSRATAS